MIRWCRRDTTAARQFTGLSRSPAVDQSRRCLLLCDLFEDTLNVLWTSGVRNNPQPALTCALFAAFETGGSNGRSGFIEVA